MLTQNSAEIAEPVDPARFAPGSFGCHEALHLTSVVRDMVAEHLVDHPAVRAKPEWLALAAQASTALGDLYQAIGRQHLTIKRARTPAMHAAPIMTGNSE